MLQMMGSIWRRRVDEGFWRQAASNDAKAAGQDGSSKSAAGVGRSTKRQRAVLPKRKRLKQLQKAAKRCVVHTSLLGT